MANAKVKGRVLFTDDNKSSAKKEAYKPKILFTDDDKEVKRLVGMTSKDKLNEWFHG